MKWYTVEEEFLNFIREYENRIPKTNYGLNKLKPFFGSLFEVEDLVYISQVSHAQERHYKIPENLDFIKLYDKKRLLAVVNLNYMFPVPKDKLIEVNYKNIQNFRSFIDEKQRNNYITLLKKEIKQLKEKDISAKARRVYELKYNYPDNKVAQRCIDFKKIEIKCRENIKNKN